METAFVRCELGGTVGCITRFAPGIPPGEKAMFFQIHAVWILKCRLIRMTPPSASQPKGRSVVGQAQGGIRSRPRPLPRCLILRQLG